ncbi:MAG: beta-glucosidase BglX [Hyphomicrobiales bacterium]|nr:beta-glucosidase BglX [Hyphomicrobiales bacterium]
MTFIDRLLSSMTLQEKIGQLNLVSYGKVDTGTVKSVDVAKKIARGEAGGLFGTHDPQEARTMQKIAVEETRLGIPLLFGLDVIHGHKTIFPIPLALSCSWNLELIRRSARIAAIEATAEGVNWAFSPMVDIARDPRWGRVSEGAGEDTYLGCQVAAAMVHGLQDDDLKREDTLMACVKHMGLYGAVEAGREYNSVDMSAVRMLEDYLPPYKAALDAGAGSIMTAFNDINGVPATAHPEILNGLLRTRWGFDGLVVTDYTAINEMIEHGMGDLHDVSAIALHSGVDMDMVGEGFLETLSHSLETGHVTDAQIDQACRRILAAKEKLGLFDDPYRYCNEDRAATRVLTPDHRAFARKAIAESCVLLKNTGNILPLRKDTKIALVGALADDTLNMNGNWSIAAESDNCISILQGMRTVAGAGAPITHARGSNITTDPRIVAAANFKIERIINDPRPAQEMIDEAVRAANAAEVIVAVVGEGQEMSGECASRADIGIPEEQRELLRELKKTGKPLVLVTVSGRPLTLAWEDENADAILHMWFAGTEAGNGVADLLFGDVNPSGKLTMTFPRHVGQVPIYYNHRRTGRPLSPGMDFEKFRSCYIDVPNTPQYSFGHGLSYTTFAYGPVELDKTSLNGERDVLTASVTVTNTGARTGREIVQLYVNDPAASMTRPVKVLRGFEKIALEPGQSQKVSFAITVDDLKFYDLTGERIWEAGEFVIHIGPSSISTQTASVIWAKDASEEAGETAKSASGTA